MYSGSVSARQSTNHNSRYRMLMDTCKFLSNLMEHIPRSSNHTCKYRNTRTSTWLHESPQDTPHRLCPAPLSLSGAVPTLPPFQGKCRCSSTSPVHYMGPCCSWQALCRWQEGIPERLHLCTWGSLPTVFWGHTFSWSSLLASSPLCQGRFCSG